MFTHLRMFFFSASDPAFNMWYFGVYYAHLNESVLWYSCFIKYGGWSSFFFSFSPSEATDTTSIFSYSPENVSNSLTQTCTRSKRLPQATLPPWLISLTLFCLQAQRVCVWEENILYHLNHFSRHLLIAVLTCTSWYVQTFWRRNWLH